MLYIRRFLLLFFGLLLVVMPVWGLEEIDGTPIPGRIAYVGEDHNIYTFDVASETIFAMTDDASTIQRYQWPTWSIDGRLAYFCCDLEYAQQFDTTAYVAPDSQTQGAAAFSGIAQSIIYASWAPYTCDETTNCLELAMLISDYRQGGLYVELLRNDDESTSSETIADATPFYYSWNPDGTQMILHLNNNELAIYDAVSRDVDANFEAASAGTFQAPAWSPVDDRFAAGVPAEEAFRTDLVVYQDNELTSLVQNIRGNVSFSWSPDGNYIAYRTLDENGLSTLNVIDSRSGELVGQTELPGVVGFFWSPDSLKIAYITPQTPSQSIRSDRFLPVNYQRTQIQQAQDAISLTWHVYSMETGLSQSLNSFTPTPGFVYMLLYFDQFNQSHSVWSPDSQHLVYTELMLADSPVSLVQIRDVSDVAATPITIDNGTFAVWSYDE